jgi:hypothetical protein
MSCGCLSINGALTGGEAAESIKQELRVRRAQFESDLRARFERAKSEGDLPDEADPTALARYIATISQGSRCRPSAVPPGRTQEDRRDGSDDLPPWSGRSARCIAGFCRGENALCA